MRARGLPPGNGHDRGLRFARLGSACAKRRQRREQARQRRGRRQLVFESIRHPGQVRVAIVWLLGHSLFDDAHQTRRQIRTKQRHSGRGFIQDSVKEIWSRFTRKRRLSGQRLVQQHAETVHIGTFIDRCRTQNMLGRHVARRAHGQRRGLPGRRVHRPFHHDRDAEIQHLCGHDAPVWPNANEDVLRLEIAVDHALSVGSCHPMHGG